jgi:predicted secreted hydrolase
MLLQYREATHGSIDEEWLPHRRATEWWYVTGYIHAVNAPELVYSYQFTVFNPWFLGKNLWFLHLAFTDMQTMQHCFEPKIKCNPWQRGISRKGISMFKASRLDICDGGMKISGLFKDVTLDLTLEEGKGVVWHGDNGVLVMGDPHRPGQRTVYCSFPNMPTNGKVTISGENGDRSFEVTGKSWFDRQWGPFRMFHTGSYWEWFSLRFFDDEEVMLFDFPQHPYRDGTYINKNGETRRMRNFTCTHHGLKRQGKLQYSYGWDIYLPGVKDELYRVLPMNDRQYNRRYYEVLARILKQDGTEAGYGFVELLPGVRQDGAKYNFLRLLFPGNKVKEQDGTALL